MGFGQSESQPVPSEAHFQAQGLNLEGDTMPSRRRKAVPGRCSLPMGYAHPMELMQQGFQVPTWMRGQMMPQQMMVENQEPGEGDDESSSSTLGYSNMG